MARAPVRRPMQPSPRVPPIDADEAQRLVAAGTARLLDVREAHELASARIPEAVHIPMMQVPDRLEELEREATWVIVCHSGARSLQVARFMAANGFPDVMNLDGGIVDWYQRGHPVETGGG